MVTLDDLYSDAHMFLADNYGMALGIPIVINDEYVVAGGSFMHTRTGRSLQIDIALNIIEFAEPDIVYDVLRHELVHYALFERGEDFEDGSPKFEAELIRLQIQPTGALQIGVYHTYVCDECGDKTQAPLYVKHSGKKWKTRCCKATFTLVPREKRIYNGRSRVY